MGIKKPPNLGKKSPHVTQCILCYMPAKKKIGLIPELKNHSRRRSRSSGIVMDQLYTNEAPCQEKVFGIAVFLKARIDRKQIKPPPCLSFPGKTAACKYPFKNKICALNPRTKRPSLQGLGLPPVLAQPALGFGKPCPARKCFRSSVQ